MQTKIKHSLSGILAFMLYLLTSSICHSYDGGSYHSRGEGPHGRNHYHGREGYYSRNGYRDGYYGGPVVIIGLPFGDYDGPEYYAPPCETIRICNSMGRCWLEQECD